MPKQEAVKSIETRVRERVEELLGVDPQEITRNADFQEDLGADSLDCVEIVMMCEEEFSIEIPDEDAEACKTVGQLIDKVTALGAK